MVSQVPQHFRSSESRATCDGCFVRAVISFDSCISGHPQESLEVNIEHWHIPFWAFRSTFRFL